MLCEKPMTPYSSQTRELCDIAKTNNCFLMEALWSRAFPAYRRIRQELKKNSIGNVKHVEAQLSMNIASVERIAKKELFGGVTLDLGKK